MQIGAGGAAGSLGTGNVVDNAALTFNRSDNITVANVISGTGTLTQAGTGTTTLTGANTYTGTTTVSAGSLNIQNATALGTTAAGTTVSAGAALELQGGITVGAEALTLNGTGVSGNGALRNVSGTNGYQGQVTLGSASTISSAAGQVDFTVNGIDNNGFLLTVDGAGAVNVSGGAIIKGTGGLTKNGTGTTTLAGVNTYTGDTTVATGTLNLTGSITSNVTNNATFTSTGTTTRTVTNNSTVNANNGSIFNGSIVNNAGGQFNVAGTVATNNAAATFNNAGTLAINSGTYTMAGTAGTTVLNNTGTLTVANGATLTLTTGNLSNAGTLTNNGTVNDDLFNTGTVTNNGTYNANVASNTGTINNNLTWNGNFVTSGTVNNTGTINGTLTSSGGTVTNTGIITGLVTLNSGRLAGAGTLGGGLTGSATSTVSLANGTAGETMTINGNYNTGGGAIALDISLAAPKVTADKITVNGALTGVVNLNFTQIGAATVDTPGDTVVISSTNAAGSSLGTVTGLPTNGVFVNNQVVNSGNNYVVRTSLNLAPLGGLVGSISATQSVVNSVVNRPSSAFVAAPIGVDPNTCAPGTYSRLTGGGATTKSTTTSGGSSSDTTVRSEFSGIQVGLDMGCFNIGGKGSSVNFGILAGLNGGTAKQDEYFNTTRHLVGNTNFNTRYIGAYATYAQGSFFADTQAVFDWADFDINSTVDGNVFVKTNGFKTRRMTVNASAGYAFSFDDISIVPSLGISYSLTKRVASQSTLRPTVLCSSAIKPVYWV